MWSVSTVSLFEAGWAIFFNFFVWNYIYLNLKDKGLFDLDATHIKRLLLAPILLVGYVWISVYVFIFLAFGLVVLGGYLTGYWVLDRNKAEGYKEVLV